MRVSMCDCVGTILREIAMPEMKRRDVAQSYHLALRSTENVDWAAINAAIINRWSTSGLIWIKTQAHSGKCFEDASLTSGDQEQRHV